MSLAHVESIRIRFAKQIYEQNWHICTCNSNREPLSHNVVFVLKSVEAKQKAVGHLNLQSGAITLLHQQTCQQKKFTRSRAAHVHRVKHLPCADPQPISALSPTDGTPRSHWHVQAPTNPSSRKPRDRAPLAHSAKFETSLF